MQCSGARWRTCLSDGNAPGTRAAGAGGRFEGKAYLPKASGRIRLNFEEVPGRQFDSCRRMEADGGVGTGLILPRGMTAVRSALRQSLARTVFSSANASSSHRVCVGSTFNRIIGLAFGGAAIRANVALC